MYPESNHTKALLPQSNQTLQGLWQLSNQGYDFVFPDYLFAERMYSRHSLRVFAAGVSGCVWYLAGFPGGGTTYHVCGKQNDEKGLTKRKQVL